jgi:hypothetical protein
MNSTIELYGFAVQIAREERKTKGKGSGKGSGVNPKQKGIDYYSQGHDGKGAQKICQKVGRKLIFCQRNSKQSWKQRSFGIAMIWLITG